MICLWCCAFPLFCASIIKLTKDKENLEAVREKPIVTNKGNPTRLNFLVLAYILYASREWYSKCWKKKLPPRISYPAKLSIRHEGERKNFMFNLFGVLWAYWIWMCISLSRLGFSLLFLWISFLFLCLSFLLLGLL